jgi:hypothetical protein
VIIGRKHGLLKYGILPDSFTWNQSKMRAATSAFASMSKSASLILNLKDW